MKLVTISLLVLGLILSVTSCSTSAAPAKATPTPTSKAEPTPAASPQAVSSPTAESSGTSYSVEAGDTLYSIATKFNTTVDAIVAANKIANPDVISIGQKLTIPKPAR